MLKQFILRVSGEKIDNQREIKHRKMFLPNKNQKLWFVSNNVERIPCVSFALDSPKAICTHNRMTYTKRDSFTHSYSYTYIHMHKHMRTVLWQNLYSWIQLTTYTRSWCSPFFLFNICSVTRVWCKRVLELVSPLASACMCACICTLSLVQKRKEKKQKSEKWMSEWALCIMRYLFRVSNQTQQMVSLSV